MSMREIYTIEYTEKLSSIRQSDKDDMESEMFNMFKLKAGTLHPAPYYISIIGYTSRVYFERKDNAPPDAFWTAKFKYTHLLKQEDGLYL